MSRERTSLNLAIGLIMSLLLHAYLVIWGPSFSLSVPALQPPTEIEVQVREWPSPTVAPSAVEPLTSAEPPAPPPPQPAQPAIPPDTVVLRQAERAALLPMQPDQAEVRLPEPPPLLPSPAPEDLTRVAQALQESLHTDPPPLPASRPASLPEPERRLAEHRDLPPLPDLGRAPRQAPTPSRAVPMTLPATDPTLQIKGPAADREVIFQPPPPTATVEAETDIELRFWILPNGSVSRVVPLKKSDPRLEALATNYLRRWRFNALPPGVEPDEQWGIIPFKFRIR